MSKLRNENAPMYVFMAILLVAIGISFYVQHHETSEVTKRVAKIESPCLKYTEDKTRHNKLLCEESFEEAVATITHPDACVIERKAGTLRAIRELASELKVGFTEPCSGAHIRKELAREKKSRKDRAHEGAHTVNPSGSTEHSNPSPAATQPAPPTGGSHPTHHHGSTPGAANPTQPATATPPPSPPTTTTPSGQTVPEQARPKGLQVQDPTLPLELCAHPLAGVNC